MSLSRNASPSALTSADMHNQNRRVVLSANGYDPKDDDIILHKFASPCRLYGIEFASIIGDGFTAKITVKKNSVSIVKDAGIVNTATAVAQDAVLDIPFLDANTDGYVDFAIGDVLYAQMTNSANVGASDRASLTLDLIRI